MSRWDTPWGTGIFSRRRWDTSQFPGQIELLYGMRGILMTFMTMHVMANGVKAPMTETDATFWFHIVASAVYFTPMLGAILADRWWGK